MMIKIKEYKWSAVIVVGAAGLAGAAATDRFQLQTHDTRINEIEARQASDHDTLTKISVDVGWIRRTIEDR